MNLGFGGACMLSALWGLVMLIRWVCQRIFWSRKPLLLATVEELIETKKNHKNPKRDNYTVVSTEYKYRLSFQYQGKEMHGELVDRKSKNKPSSYSVGDKVELYYNSKELCEEESYKTKSAMKAYLNRGLIFFFSGLVGVAITFLFLALLRH